MLFNSKINSTPWFLIFYFGILLLLLSCRSTNTTNSRNLMSNQQQVTHLDYTDGNGNNYYIGQNELIYKPIEVHESSSGVYSGGQPAQIPLDPSQYAQLIKQVQGMETATNTHIQNRPKGSGAFSIYHNDSTKSKTQFIVRPNNQLLKTWNNTLKQLLQKP